MSISVSDLAFAYPSGGELFFDVSFSVKPGDHVGLVGANGVGKSSLMKILAEEQRATDGAVRIDGEFVYMPQSVGYVEGMTVRELLLSYAPPHVRTVGLRVADAEKHLAAGDESAGMDLGDAIQQWGDVGGYELEGKWDASIKRVVRSSLMNIGDEPSSRLSGGEVKQLVLDLAFSSDANVLLLDEPDNYLDIPAKLALEQAIRDSKKTILTISHDRQLLSSAMNKIVTLESSGAWVHGGSYATYVAARTARIERAGDERKRWEEERQRLYKHMKDRKEQAKISPRLASVASAAETRYERYVAAGPPPEPAKDERITVSLRGSASGQRMLLAKDVSLDGLIRPFEVEIRQGERIGLIGPNGSGKSHMLRLFAGTQIPTTGSITLGSRVSSGTFSQVNNRPDFMGVDVLEIVERQTGNYEAAMRILARYGLQGHSRRSFDTLSGGQKARLEILYLELEGHNLLLLDEPTDNLDIDSSEALEHALDGFEGTCISVSHDRSYLEKQDRFLLLGHDGRLFELFDFDAAMNAITSRNAGPKAKALNENGIGANLTRSKNM